MRRASAPARTGSRRPRCAPGRGPRRRAGGPGAAAPGARGGGARRRTAGRPEARDVEPSAVLDHLEPQLLEGEVGQLHAAGEERAQLMPTRPSVDGDERARVPKRGSSATCRSLQPHRGRREDAQTENEAKRTGRPSDLAGGLRDIGLDTGGVDQPGQREQRGQHAARPGPPSRDDQPLQRAQVASCRPSQRSAYADAPHRSNRETTSCRIRVGATGSGGPSRSSCGPPARGGRRRPARAGRSSPPAA